MRVTYVMWQFENTANSELKFRLLGHFCNVQFTPPTLVENWESEQVENLSSLVESRRQCQRVRRQS